MSLQAVATAPWSLDIGDRIMIGDRTLTLTEILQVGRSWRLATKELDEVIAWPPDTDVMRVTEPPGEIRQFTSGATRDTEDGKYDYEGFLSPQVLDRFAEYMQKHREQSDGKLRDGDNWQKGIPKDAYIKSLWRHFMDVWLMHRGIGSVRTDDIEEALCACMFNVMGYLFEEMNGR